MKKFWILMGVFIIAGVICPVQTAAQSPVRVIVSATAPVLVKPDAAMTPLRLAQEGSVLKVIASEGEWYRIELDDPQWGLRVGYVEKRHVSVIAAPTQQAVNLTVPESKASSVVQPPIAAGAEPRATVMSGTAWAQERETPPPATIWVTCFDRNGDYRAQVEATQDQWNFMTGDQQALACAKSRPSTRKKVEATGKVKAITKQVKTGPAMAGFRNSTSAEASGKLASLCMVNALTVVSSQPNEVVCEQKMSMLKSALAQVLIGNSYSTPPRSLVRFTVAEIGNDAIVQANRWLETQMAFGQIRRQDLTGDKHRNDLFNFLLAAGAVPMEDLVASEGHAPAESVQNPNSISIADEIAKLAGLRDKGILTEAEFQAQKAALLKR